MEVKILKCDICGKDRPEPKGWFRLNGWDVCSDCAGDNSGLSIAYNRLKVKKDKNEAQRKQT